jgi:hypothetical protein
MLEDPATYDDVDALVFERERVTAATDPVSDAFVLCELAIVDVNAPRALSQERASVPTEEPSRAAPHVNDHTIVATDISNRI